MSRAGEPARGADGRLEARGGGHGNAGRLERLPDLLAVLSDQHRVADAPARDLGEGPEVLPLALAPGDQHDRLAETLEGPDRRGDVGALRVVEEGHAPDVAHELDAVGDAAKDADAATDRVRGHAGPERPRRRRQDVLDVVRAAQRDLGERADLLGVAVQLGHDPTIPYEGAVVERREPAEPEHVGHGPLGEAPGDLVVPVQHGAVGGRLVLEDPRLGPQVGGKALMAVEMVGRDVQYHGDPRAKRLDRLELEARRLRHHNAVGREGQRVGGERRADVPADEHRARLLPEERAEQRGRRGLAIGTGDGDGVGVHHPPGELELANHGRHRPELGEDRGVEGDARAHDDEVRAPEGLGGVSAGEDAGAERLQRARLDPQGRERLLVGRDDAGAARDQQAHRRHAAPAEADDRHPPSPQPVAIGLSPGHDPHLLQERHRRLT